MPDIDNLLPLINNCFKPGECLKSIEKIENPIARELARANYYQQIGNTEEAIRIAKLYMDHEDPFAQVSAYITLFFTELADGNKPGAEQAMSNLEKIKFDSSVPYGGKLFAETIKNMIFSSGEEFVLDQSLNALPEGVRCYISYFYSLHEILRGRTEEAIGIAKTSLIMGANKYPIPAIYLNVILGAGYTFKKDFAKADAYYNEAWNIASPDKFIMPFVQQSLMIFGFDKKHIRDNYPDDYKAITSHIKPYLTAWGGVSNNINWFDNSEVSRMELIVGVLFKHGFAIKEISDVLGISPNTIKTHLMAMRQKTGAQGRAETLKINVE